MEADIPSEWVLGYTAGIIDGEGSITQLYTPAAVNRRSRYRVQVGQSATNNGLVLCNWLRDSWGMGKVYEQYGLCHMYIWNITRINDIGRILTACVPFMLVKKSRGQELLDYLSGGDGTRRGIWTARELAILRESGATVPATELAKRLQRGVNAVRAKRNELGLGAPEWHTRARSSHYQSD